MKNAISKMIATLFFAVAAQAAEPDLVALQKQLQELSAKIALLEQQAAQKNNMPTVVEERLDVLEKNAAGSSWLLNTQVKGDFRYRYENVDRGGATYKDRQRVRFRVGATGKVNDFIRYGARVATGGASATSSNQDIDGGSKKSVMLDRYYVDLHPEMLLGAHLILGKMGQPWIDRTGLIWDSDLNPEGVALTYETTHSNGVQFLANIGSFVIDENGGDDLQLWAGQLAGETQVGPATVRVGLSDFYYQNAGDQGAGLVTTGANTPGTEFHLVEAFGSVGSTVGGVPVALNGQYVQNVAATSSDDTAYLVGLKVGKAKDVGSWEAGYHFRDTGADAVPDGFNDSDFAYGSTATHGHSVWAKYQIAKNIQGGVSYLMAVDDAKQKINTFQLDLNLKF